MKSCCEYVAERLEQYHDGALPKNEALHMQQNFAACPDCRAQLALIERIDAMGSAPFYKEPDAAYFADLSARIAARTTAAAQSSVTVLDLLRPVQNWWNQAGFMKPAVGFAAAAAVILMVTQVVYHPFETPTVDNGAGMATLNTPIAEAENTPEPVRSNDNVADSRQATSTPDTESPATTSEAKDIAENSDESALASLERINPLRDRSTLDPIMDSDHQDNNTDVATLFEEPNSESSRLKTDGSLLEEGGVQQPGQSSGTLASRTGETGRQTGLIGQAADRSRAADPDKTENSVFQQMPLADLISKKDELLRVLDQQSDPLVRNMTVKTLDSVYQAILEQDASAQQQMEARTFYSQYESILTTLLGTTQYQNRLTRLSQ
jgi:hypothetical protein